MPSNILMIIAIVVYVCYSQVATKKLKPSKFTTIPIIEGIISDQYNGLATVMPAMKKIE